MDLLGYMYENTVSQNYFKMNSQDGTSVQMDGPDQLFLHKCTKSWGRNDKFTSDLLAQTCEHPTRSSILIMPMVDYKSSENNEFVSQLENSFGDVDGYKVKKEMVPLLKAIFKKLNQISKTRQLVVGVSTLEDVEAITILVIDEKQKAVETFEKDGKCSNFKGSLLMFFKGCSQKPLSPYSTK
ncbi:hypothetical protein Pfo_000457 [Paulownia fortunei]|nr:hypothetical protein Pfo_000457 [Paulownia fortunei]